MKAYLFFSILLACISNYGIAQLPRQLKDLEKMPISEGEATPGKRVRQYNQIYSNSNIFHLLYLPTDWKKGKKYPVIVEYPGNGREIEGHLGYGISAGKGVIWASMPFVDKKNMKNAKKWWGDVNSTIEYCKTTVARICEDYGGDASKVFLVGHSRGSMAVNYIGLHNDEIASLWKGFVCNSHYDAAVPNWATLKRKDARDRLMRLKGRPQFISHEKTKEDAVSSLSNTRDYLKETLPNGNFTFQELSFENHTDL